MRQRSRPARLPQHRDRFTILDPVGNFGEITLFPVPVNFFGWNFFVRHDLLVVLSVVELNDLVRKVAEKKTPAVPKMPIGKIVRPRGAVSDSPTVAESVRAKRYSKQSKFFGGAPQSLDAKTLSENGFGTISQNLSPEAEQEKLQKRFAALADQGPDQSSGRTRLAVAAIGGIAILGGVALWAGGQLFGGDLFIEQPVRHLAQAPTVQTTPAAQTSPSASIDAISPPASDARLALSNPAAAQSPVSATPGTPAQVSDRIPRPAIDFAGDVALPIPPEKLTASGTQGVLPAGAPQQIGDPVQTARLASHAVSEPEFSEIVTVSSCNYCGAGLVDHRVVLTIGQDAPATYRASTLDILSEIGFGGVDERTGGLSPDQTQIRYFHAEDAAAARLLAEPTQAEVLDLTWFRPRPSEGTLELILADEMLQNRN